MEAYNRVIRLCEENGIAPTALESKLGFGRGSIGKMRTSEMTYSRLQKIADYFNVTVEFLTTGKDAPKESDSGKVYYFSDETAEMAQDLFDDPDLRILMSASRKLSPEDLKTVKNVAESFLRKDEENA